VEPVGQAKAGEEVAEPVRGAIPLLADDGDGLEGKPAWGVQPARTSVIRRYSQRSTGRQGSNT
jgi:hypothetical protein